MFRCNIKIKGDFVFYNQVVKWVSCLENVEEIFFYFILIVYIGFVGLIVEFNEIRRVIFYG